MSNSSGSPGNGRISNLELEFAQLSDPGRIREHNEDYIGHVQPASHLQAQSHGWLFALADGVGGQACGEIASQTAVESVLGNFQKSPGGESHIPLLRRLVQAANHAVYEKGRSTGAGGVAMATTLVACAVRYDQAVVAHVGDSRCYLIRHGEAQTLTRDHTVAAEQFRLGLLSKADAEESENRHLLQRSLGHDLFVNIDIGAHQIIPGDVLALCSDGLHAPVSRNEMADLLRQQPDLGTTAAQLVRLANERDGSDNGSIQLVRIRSIERIGMYRGRPYKLH